MGSKRTVTVAFWDVDNCGLPKKYSGKGMINNIVRGLANGAGIRCWNTPDHFETYMVGDTAGSLNRKKKQLVHASGSVIEINIPHDLKGASDQVLIAQVYKWMHENGRSPANILMITGDQDFSSVVVDLRGHGHTVVVACVLKSVSPILCWSAHHVVDWEELCQGRYAPDTDPERQPRLPMSINPPPPAPPPAVVQRNRNIYVWWDYNTCPVPQDLCSNWDLVVNAHMQIPFLLHTALKNWNLHGPLRIFVYGSSTSIPGCLLQAFEDSNITFRHVQPGRKNTPCVTMLRELLGVFKTCPAYNTHVIITNENVKWAINVVKRNNVVVVAKDRDDLEYDGDVWIWKWSDLIDGLQHADETECPDT